MNEIDSGSNTWDQQTKANTIRLGYWTASWLVTMAIATFGPIFVWESKALSMIGILVNLGFGIGMIMANKRHLKGLDEMHQKIQLEAMGLALGVSLVVGLSYSLLDTTNLIAVDAEISFLVMLMGLTYFFGVLAGHRRYR